jgi:hypothetical protein
MPTHMSKLARVVALAALVAAMNLAGMTTGAQAHTSNDPANTRHRALGRLEFPATGQAARQAAGDTARRRLLAQERYYGTWGYEDPTADAQQLFHRGERASMDQPTTPTPAAVTTPVRPAEPRHQPGLLPVSLGVLAAALAMVAVVALLVGRRPHRTQRAGRTA